ncbi:MAG: superoxide dismutase [Anaerolineae bacterium]|nr:superoxide dismutase [Anaerolineae bacterium]
MKILALEREMPGAPPEKFQELGRAEARRVWDLHQAGVLRELYFRADEPAAVLVLEADSLEDAATILLELPLVKAGLIEFDLIPLRAYTGFARLFMAEE